MVMDGSYKKHNRDGRENKRHCKAALKEALQTMRIKKREAITLDRKARIRENRAMRWEQKAAQLRNEALQARELADEAQKATEVARLKVEHKLDIARKSNQVLRNALRSTKTRKLDPQGA